MNYTSIDIHNQLFETNSEHPKIGAKKTQDDKNDPQSSSTSHEHCT